MLSQEYFICEGGFSLGYFDDDNTITGLSGYRADKSEYEKKGCSFAEFANIRGEKTSITAYGSVPVFAYIDKQHPGAHILAPQSAVAAYGTEILGKGVYYFASLCFFTSGKSAFDAPVIALNGNRLNIFYGGREINILMN